MLDLVFLTRADYTDLQDQIAAGGSTTFQQEVIDFLADVKTVGGDVDTETLAKLDKFVLKGRTDGWLPKLKYLAPFVGNNLAASLVTVINTQNTTMTNNGFVEADYREDIGLTSDGYNKNLNTNFNPSLNGLGITNFTMAVSKIQLTRGNTQILVSSLPTSGEGSPMVDYLSNGISRGDYNTSNANGVRELVFVGRTNEWAGFSDGVKLTANNTPAVSNGNTLQFPITLFTGKLPDGNQYYSPGITGMIAFGLALTDAEAFSLSSAMLEFSKSVRKKSVKQGLTFSRLGDSNTAGLGSSPTDGNLLSYELGFRELNHGQSGSYMVGNASNLLSGYNRRMQVVATKPDIGFVSLGTNDSFNDGTTDGNTGTINALRDNIFYVCSDYMDKGIKPIVESIPWSSVNNATKSEAYVNGAAQGAINVGADFIDLYHLFADMEAPASYFTDGVHFNSTGYKIKADIVRLCLANKLYRNPLLTFSSLEPGTATTVTTTIPTAKVGMSVECTVPSNLYTGLILTKVFVSADNTVTYELFNASTSVIAPLPGRFPTIVSKK